MNQKIQFIICGWWYDEFDGRKGITDFIDGLINLQKENKFIDVFWSCHKEPIDLIKDNFEYKLFKNIGLEWGAYDKAFNHLNLDDDTIVFCIQDDMVIKDWSFIEKCIEEIYNGAKIIGNGFNYPMNFSPQTEARLSYWLKTKDKWIDYVRKENQHMFDIDLQALSIRGSFMCTRYDYIKEINGFEYVNKPLSYGKKEDGTKFILTDPFGNTSLYMNAYKFTKYFGVDKMKWLSNTYRKSKYMIECGRGNVKIKSDSYTKPFEIPENFLVDGCEKYEEDLINDNIHMIKMADVSWHQFNKFLKSLTVERKSWSLDLQHFKSPKDMFDNEIAKETSICVMDEKKVIGFMNLYGEPSLTDSLWISFVVKNEYQGRGLGTQLLLTAEQMILNQMPHRRILAKHYPDNIASNKAFVKAGYIQNDTVSNDSFVIMYKNLFK